MLKVMPFSLSVRRRPLSAAAAAAFVLVLGGCTGGSGSAGPEPSAASTPLAKYDTAGVALVREPFCGRISATGVVGALDGTAADSATWGNGDAAILTEGVRDVAHEFGCRYRREGAEASAWLFAPPVPPGKAAALARQAASAEGCRPAAEAPGFGRPSAAVVCTDGRASTASYRGLFGDSWLTCSLTRSGAQAADGLAEAAGRWCVEVVEAARVR